MAGANDPSLTQTPEYRIVVLFMGFIVLTYLFDKLTEWVDEYLKHRKRRGLLHTIHKLEEELLALGLISLLLIAFEEYIVKLCIDSDDDDSYGKGKLSKSKLSKAGHSGDKDDHSDDHLIDHDDHMDGGADELHDETLTDDLHNRRLLGGVMRVLLAGGGGGSVCPDGEESFWSVRAIHETHIFIFVLAVVHIVYAGLSMTLCTWKINQWKRWEDHAHRGLKKIQYSHLLDEENKCIHYGRAFFAQFHQHIDESVYLGMRRLFIERMQLSNDFDFHKFLVNSMEEEFSKVVKLEWVMWAVAAVWIATNPSVVYIMTGVMVGSTFLVGTKLESIALKLGNEAYLMYADKPAPGEQKPQTKVARNLSRISTGISQTLHLNHSHSGRHVHEHEHEKESGEHTRDLVKRDSARPELGHVKKAGPVAEAYDEDSDGRHSRESNHSKESGHDSVISLTQNNDNSYLGSTSASVTHSEGALLRRQSNGVEVQFSDQLSHMSVDATEQHEGPKHNRQGSRLYFDLGMTPRRQNAEAEKEGNGWKIPALCCFDGHSKTGNEHDETFHDSYLVPDSIGLFPFRRPRLMLKAFQFTYFETSLLIAILLFNLWHDLNPHLIIISDWVALSLVIVGIVVMFFTSILLLPVYGLTMVTGSHCPSKVLKRARKHHVKPQALHALERVSVSLNRTSMGLNRTSMNLNKTSMNLGRTSMGLNRTSLNLAKSSMNMARNEAEPEVENMIELSPAAMPTHWSELMNPEVVQEKPEEEVAAIEEDENEQGGALGMLVGAMLHTKKQELHNAISGVDGHDVSEPSEPSGGQDGPPALLKKSRSLLNRISVPLIALPDIKEVGSPVAEEEEAPVDKPKASAPPSLLRKSRSLLNRISLSRKSMKADGAEENGDEGTTGPKKRASKVTFEEPEKPQEELSHLEMRERAAGLRMTKSVFTIPVTPSLSRMSVGSQNSKPHRPSLCRASMPLIKVLDKKHQAYLEKERYDHEHLMHEHHEHDSPASTSTPLAKSKGTPKATSTPCALERSSSDSETREFDVVAMEESSGSTSESTDMSSDGGMTIHTGVTRPNSPRPSMLQVAQLFKLVGQKKQEQGKEHGN